MVNGFLNMWGEHSVPFDVFLRDAPLMAHSIDSNGVLLNVSRIWAGRLGYEPEEMIGQKSVEFLTPKSRIDAETLHLPTFMKTGRLKNVRYKFMSSNGDEVPIIMSAQGVFDGVRDRSLAIMFDNGIAQRIFDISDTISAAVNQLDSIATGLEKEKADELERIIASLKTTQID